MPRTGCDGDGAPSLAERLRLMVVTKPDPACGRPLPEVVAEVLASGATAIQLRDKRADGRRLFREARALCNLVRRAGGLFLVNDRLDVALASGADGVHLGPDDLPVRAARRIAPAGFVIGFSTDHPAAARTAAAEGADYLGVGAVFGTRTKPGLAEEAIGPFRVATVLRAARRPGVGIGGITPDNAAAVARIGAGVAVSSAVMDAEHPGETVRLLLDAVREA
ncbi:MAG: thiamine phosphate synthase [Gemmatimonadota bacterium]